MGEVLDLDRIDVIISDLEKDDLSKEQLEAYIKEINAIASQIELKKRLNDEALRQCLKDNADDENVKEIKEIIDNTKLTEEERNQRISDIVREIQDTRATEIENIKKMRAALEPQKFTGEGDEVDG